MDNRESFTDIDVRSDQWKEIFLSRITQVPGFTELVTSSRSISRAQIISSAEKIKHHAYASIKDYSSHDLARARHFYNTHHLLEFWRYYLDQIKSLTKRGLINHSFPVFKVIDCVTSNNTNIESYSIELLSEVSDLRAEIIESKKSDPSGTPLELIPLFLKLNRLRQCQNESFIAFYNIYLAEHQCRDDGIWRSYLIHFFLDNFLYRNLPMGNNGAPFDEIFMSSNLIELKIYLRHHYEESKNITIADISSFLSKQRKYNLQQALTISLGEVALINQRKQQLVYVEEENIVKLVTSKKQVDEWNSHIRDCGITRIDGCPFAKEKGVNKNAVLEVYEYFDDILTKFIDNQVEFKKLYA